MITSGCSFTRTIETINTPVEDQVVLPKPKPLELNDIEWKVITEENSKEIFEKMKESGDDPVLFSLDDEDYEDLSENNLRIKNYIKKLLQTLREYRKLNE